MADATCAGCGCACDDIEATIAEGRLTRLTRTCELGDAWFAERIAADRPPIARIEGRAVALDEAADAAAAILRRARAPLVYGLGQTSCEAQRRAVAIAEAAGAVLDPAGAGAAGLAYQALGSSTATFGEIRDRAELVVAWRADPVTTHPRLPGRLRLEVATAHRRRRPAHRDRRAGRRVHRARPGARLRGAVGAARAGRAATTRPRPCAGPCRSTGSSSSPSA